VRTEPTRLYIFDKDGTLIFSPPGHIPRLPTDQTFMPGVEEKCQALRENGDILAVASNQGGVAMGIISLAEAEAMVRDVAERIGATYYEFCPYHPEGALLDFRRDAACRKPRPGMIQSLKRRASVPWSSIVFVGNDPDDYGAALAANVRFVWANDFF